MSATTEHRYESYEQACAQHRWQVPARYNIAADICDRHPRDKLAKASCRTCPTPRATSTLANNVEDGSDPALDVGSVRRRGDPSRPRRAR
jgi:hypothetical protein